MLLDMEFSPKTPAIHVVAPPIFDIQRELDGTLQQAELYGITKMQPSQIEDSLRHFADEFTSPGIIVLSLANNVPLRHLIAASNTLPVPSPAYVEQDDLLSLADEANQRPGASIRYLPYADNDYGTERIGQLYNYDQKDQKRKGKEAHAEFHQAHPDFIQDFATVQEVVSAFDRHLIMQKEGKQVFHSGWYRTFIQAPGGVGSRRLCVNSNDGRLWLDWNDYLGAFQGVGVVFSVGEKIVAAT